MARHRTDTAPPTTRFEGRQPASRFDIDDISVGAPEEANLLRSRRFASVVVRCPRGVSIHRTILKRVGGSLGGRNAMVSIDGTTLFLRFAIGPYEPHAQPLVERFAESVARAISPDHALVEEARLLSFDTSDLDDYLLPEHRPLSP
jgi:hypothetical protein